MLKHSYKLTSKMILWYSTILFWIISSAWHCSRIFNILYIYMYMPKSDAEKMTVKGSHGDSSLQRESDSFRAKRTVLWQGTAVQSTPQGPTKQQHINTRGFHTQNQSDQQLYSNTNNCKTYTLWQASTERRIYATEHEANHSIKHGDCKIFLTITWDVDHG